MAIRGLFPSRAIGLRAALLALAAWAAAGCDEQFVDPTVLPDANAQLVVLSGSNQSGAMGALLRSPLRVQLRDARGNPIPRQRVEFRTVFGDGLLTATAAVTDFSGQTEVGFVPLSEGDLIVQAAAGGAGALANFSLFAIDSSEVRNPASFEIVGGNNQRGAVGTILPLPLAVRVRNADGNPLENFPVLFTVTTDGALLLTANEGDFTQSDSLGNAPSVSDSLGRQVVSFTDPNGVAAALLRLRTRPGTNTVVASTSFASGSSSDVTFTAQSEAGGGSDASAVVKISGDEQNVMQDTTGIGSTSSITFNPMVVQVTDRFGNPIPGVQVFFRISVGFGSLSAGGGPCSNDLCVVTTDAGGFAQVTYTSDAGSLGGVGVSASAPGVGTATFTGEITAEGGTEESGGGGGGGGGG